MVRRGRAGAVEPSTSGQRRLDESFGENEEARSEAEYRALRETKGSHTVLPYEERVVAWIREREEAMRKRGDPLLTPPTEKAQGRPEGEPSASPAERKPAVPGSADPNKT